MMENMDPEALAEVQGDVTILFASFAHCCTGKSNADSDGNSVDAPPKAAIKPPSI